MSAEKPCEKGTVKSMVDRLSKDFGGSNRTNELPTMRPNRDKVTSVVGSSGSGPPSGTGIGSFIHSTLSGGSSSTNAAITTAAAAATTTTTTTNDTAVVRFSYTAQQPDELDLKEGDELLVLEPVEDGWARGEILRSSGHPSRKGRVGLYPTNFVSTAPVTLATQTPPQSTLLTSTRPIDISAQERPSTETNAHLNTGTNSSSIPMLSSSAPKSSSILSGNKNTPGNAAINNNEQHGNEMRTASASSPPPTSGGVLRTGNLLPSALLKANVVTAGARQQTATSGPSTISSSSKIPAAPISTLEHLAAGFGGGTAPAKVGIVTAHDHHHHQPAVHPATTTTTTTTSTFPTKHKEFAKVLYKYEAAAPDELSLPEGAVVAVITRQCEDEGWFMAESDGRHGLFPDNFVKFLPAEMAPPTFSPGSQPQQQPPTLPVKPLKFQQQQHGQTTQQLAAPVASIRDSLSGPMINSSVANLTITEQPTGGPTPEKTSAVSPAPPTIPGLSPASFTATDMENNNNSNNSGGSGSSNNFNLAGNRRSMIAGLQSKLFPDGKLPQPQRPPSHNSMNTTGGTHGGRAGAEISVEPKMLLLDMDGGGGSGAVDVLVQPPQQQLLVSSNSSIVKSRTGIAPSKKRPPSKVNPSSMLISSIVGGGGGSDSSSSSTLINGGGGGGIGELFPSSENCSGSNNQHHQSPLHTTTTAIGSKQRPFGVVAGAAAQLPSPPISQQPTNNNTTNSRATVFSSQPTSPPPLSPNNASQPPPSTLLCPISEEQQQQQPKVGAMGAASPFPSMLSSSSTPPATANSMGATLPEMDVTDHHIGWSPGVILSSAGGGHLPAAAPPSSSSSADSQWISRAEFAHFQLECQRKIADLQAEVRELRQRVDTMAAQNN